ncbi:Invasion protein IalB, involved in pathogenesis [Yoonia tamlensis]|uniref:Invasion protein IalB, involved in pathogenesis n=1 Tax=Yoonia tamlensis TaxID=390270 RepID=A0A1I6GDM6_9RHOB|nr:invasion associated locus B family protein [Yoonia tamlensis]SFR40286.1 Invasion protein IalB, involved in pathogenesis [Yoonia tamlensis]
MRSALKSIFLAAMVMQASVAIAQDTAETPATETAQVGDDLDLGQPAGPAVGQTYLLQQFGDWAMRCVRAPEGESDPCNLYQLLSDDQGNAIAEVNFFRLPEGAGAAAGATIVVPLETLLTQQLTIAVDGQNARSYPFRFCNAGGCIARLGFTPEEIDQFKRGAKATVRLVHAANPGQEIMLDLSLNGFTAGYEGTVDTGE